MIDHVTVRVADMEATKAFYSKALAPLGYSKTFEQDFDSVKVTGFGKGGKTDTWFTTDKPVSGPVHLAWKAASKEEVNVFHKEALMAGGKDNGAPGNRPEYHKNYYGAFVLDPDGNNVEVVFGN